MKLEEQVISLEYARKLKELGVKQDSLFTWTDDPAKLKPYIAYRQDKNYCYHYSAFTVAELGEMIHTICNEWAQGYSDSGCYYLFQYGQRGAGAMIQGIGRTFGADEETEADSRAALIAHLLENNLIKLDDINAN